VTQGRRTRVEAASHQVFFARLLHLVPAATAEQPAAVSKRPAAEASGSSVLEQLNGVAGGGGGGGRG